MQFVIPGAPHIDLADSYTAIIIGLVHSYLPYMILTCYLSLQAIDDCLIEAARSLGAWGPPSCGASSCRWRCRGWPPARS